MLTTVAVTIILVLASVLVHYETLLRSSIFMKRIRIRHRLYILFGIIGALIGHVLEVWIFAFGYYFLVKSGQYGILIGDIPDGLNDFAYYSFSVYTSLGFGDIYPVGHLRFLTGMEALTGLVLIAWTASFIFFQMQRFWNE